MPSKFIHYKERGHNGTRRSVRNHQSISIVWETNNQIRGVGAILPPAAEGQHKSRI
jgi:hypothetical protein